MTKSPARKKKRPTVLDIKTPRSGRATLDVFRLLAEDVGSQTPEGWFTIPWRDGRNAIYLVSQLYLKSRVGLGFHESTAIMALGADENDDDVYFFCEDLRADVAKLDISFTEQTLLTVRLRMLQLLVSNSHGGGHGYNTVLLKDWHKLDLSKVRDVAETVSYYRLLDAMGAETNPRRRAAFLEAWNAGLFRAAYALGGQIR